MNSQKQWGFTIIELILFLGITGMLFAGLMIGVNTSITTQRYKESAMSYKTLIEAQYSYVEHPRNSRDSHWNCDATQGVTPDVAGGAPRGTSRCVLLGRYFEVKDDGTKVETGDVVGVEPSVGTSGMTSDLDVLQAYVPRKSPINVELEDVSWQSRIQTVDGAGSNASFLILRSPLSGIIRTFGSTLALPDQLTSSVTSLAASSEIKNCVAPSGFVSIPVSSVAVSAAVGSANGVVLNGDDSEC